MTGEEAIRYIGSVSWRGSRPGLARTQELLARMGHPEEKLKFVHIAGTNGKGSTAAMLAAVLQQAGYRTGLYTSPYLERFHERMQVDGVPISDEELGAVTRDIAPLAEAMEDHPTEFELVTCVALGWFLRRECDIVVLETGLGGRLDSTNAIPAPEACVITNIGLDHTRELGDTLVKIAGEKAGIIKPGAPVVLYQQEPEVEEVFRRVCQIQGAGLSTADFTQIQVKRDTLEGQEFDCGPWKGVKISLLGEHQRRNAAVVLDTVGVLRGRGWRIPDRAVYQGLAQARWPGRFEVLCRRPVFIADGGHNPQCAAALKANLEAYFPGRKITFLLGVLADKDYRTELDLIAPLARRFFTVTPDSPRALPGEELARCLAPYGRPVTVCASVARGIEEVFAQAGEEEIICSFGSLYMTGEVRSRVLTRLS